MAQKTTTNQTHRIANTANELLWNAISMRLEFLNVDAVNVLIRVSNKANGHSLFVYIYVLFTKRKIDHVG